MKVTSFNSSSENVVWLQWSRFKRREKSLILFVGGSILIHLIVWIIWHFLIAPYPIALTLPLSYSLPEPIGWVHDYLWPFANTVVLAVNVWLIRTLYKKDIFAAWLLVGGNLFVQFLILSVTLYLASFSSPF